MVVTPCRNWTNTYLNWMLFFCSSCCLKLQGGGSWIDASRKRPKFGCIFCLTFKPSKNLSNSANICKQGCWCWMVLLCFSLSPSLLLCFDERLRFTFVLLHAISLDKFNWSLNSCLESWNHYHLINQTQSRNSDLHGCVCFFFCIWENVFYHRL